MSALVRRVLQNIFIVPLVRLIARPFVVKGTAPVERPVIFAANHTGHADVPVVLAALPACARGRVRSAAAADYFYAGHPLSGWLATVVVGAFPFPRERGSTLGLERAARLLARGQLVLVFPEGTRSRNGAINQFKLGAARLALQTGIPLVPVHLTGTREILPPGSWRPRHHGVRVVFGTPLVPEPGETAPELTERLRAAVISLG